VVLPSGRAIEVVYFENVAPEPVQHAHPAPDRPRRTRVVTVARRAMRMRVRDGRRTLRPDRRGRVRVRFGGRRAVKLRIGRRVIVVPRCGAVRRLAAR
jgi:hypothetical protein